MLTLLCYRNNNQQREFMELLTRALEEDLVARDDQSGAGISFSTLKDAFSIGKDVFEGAKGIHDIFSNNQQQQPQQKREFEDLFVRALEEELMARQDDQSGAFKINSGMIKDGVDIANGVIDGINGIKSFFA